MSLEKKSFVVFGGASGLGQATACALAGRGANVMVSDLVEDGLGRVRAVPGSTVAYGSADVANEDHLRGVFSMAIERFGRVDGVVNTAGIAYGEKLIGKSGAHSVANFERVIRINLIGSFNVLRMAAEAMVRNAPGDDHERGVIVNTASIAAFEGQVGQVAYAASKAGVVGMTLPAARDLARHGIRVVTLAPGLFGTPMVAGLPEEVKASLERLVPFPSRLGQPEEYAALVCHVLENRMLNGETIRLDGALRMPPQ